MDERRNIYGANTFYIDTFIALITYENDYIHMGLVSEDRFKSLKKVANIDELVGNLSGLEQFTTNQILDMILEHKEVEVILGKKYGGIIIFKGTVEDLFYNVIDGKGYNEVTASMMKFVTRKYISDSKLLLNSAVNIKYLHEFKGCRLVNEVIAKTIDISEDSIKRFVNYMDDLDCICDYTKSGILKKIEGKGISISLNENPFNLILSKALDKCDLFDMIIDSDTVWETQSITNCNIDTLTIKECKIYNEDTIFYDCYIQKLIIKRKEVPSYLFEKCDIKEIILSDETVAIEAHSFYDCTIASVETAKVYEIKKEAFKKCNIGSFMAPNNLRVLGNECLADTQINYMDIEFDNLLRIGEYALQNSSADIDVILTNKLNYLYDDAFINSGIRSLINNSSFEVSVEGCNNLKKIETTNKCKIKDLDIEEVILKYERVENETIQGCNKLNILTIDCTSKLELDIDFIVDSTLNKLVINAEEVVYKYNDSEVTQEVFMDNIVNSINNPELSIVLNGNELEYIDDEL